MNRVWALDFMRDTLYDGRSFRTLNVIDEGNREALRIECSRSITVSRLVRVMDESINVYGKPLAIRLDNGPEMMADAFVQWARDQSIALWYIQPGKPNQKAFIECFNRSFRAEVLDANLFVSLDSVQEMADAWMSAYNDERRHESLGNVAPTTFLPRVFSTPSL
ncbi:MAG: integrase core domain-containing protein [Lautropia sp.]|nr:integrase core domain-containing protein [Lautropia sp.]